MQPDLDFESASGFWAPAAVDQDDDRLVVPVLLGAAVELEVIDAIRDLGLAHALIHLDETALEELVARMVEAKLKELGVVGPAGEYLSTGAAAKLASVAPETIRRWIVEGRLPEHRAGRVVRVRRGDLEKLLKQGRRRPENMSPEAMALRDDQESR